ncbi:MAG: hypothetical protein QOJ73_1056 [Streptosporangiaceae bacterium]|nr:hypothetical protein [Streptosporangiaceae bacterium]
MSSCANGHAVPAGAEHCGICGEDVRPLCYQGHRSAPGSRFCDTCGALLAAEPAPSAAGLPAADLVTDYTSGSFSDFFAENAAGRSDDGTPILPAAAASAKAATSSAAAASAAAHVRRARRWQSLGMGLAVLIAAAIIGDFALHHHAGHQAKTTERPLGTTSTTSASAAPAPAPSPSPSPSSTPTASASATPTPAPTPAAVPAQRVIPAATGRPPDPAGPDSHYPGFLPPSRDVLRGWPFLPPELGDRQRQAILRIVLPFRGFPSGGLPDHSGFHQR